MKPESQQGFTLLELSIVLVIIGILSSTLLQPLGNSLEAGKRRDTEQLLDMVNQSLIGFAIAHGRLPCPAPFDGPAYEAEQCEGDSIKGTVPAITLGLPTNRNAAGAALDAWNQPLHYVVSGVDHTEAGQAGAADFTSSGEMQRVGMANLAASIQVCAEPANANCPRRSLLANQVPVLVFSTGKPAEPSDLESENLDDDSVFVSRDYSQVQGLHFDDLITWIPENLLFYRMMQAGVLP